MTSFARSISTFCILAAITGAISMRAGIAQGAADQVRSQEFELKSRVFENTRKIRVFLPPSYFDPEQDERHYPVFYFTDGVAAWHEWGVPETAGKLWESGEIVEAIFVGIDNGGSTPQSKNPSADRASEYLPYEDPTWDESTRPAPRGDRFPAFLFDEVMPAVNDRYRTKTGAANTGLAGASYGAVAALYTGMTHPDRIGLLLVESPSLHVGDGALIDDVAAAKSIPARVCLGVGTAEGDTPESREQMLTMTRRLHETMHDRFPSTNLRLEVIDGGTHWFSAWHDRLPDALRFLLGTGEATH